MNPNIRKASLILVAITLVFCCAAGLNLVAAQDAKPTKFARFRAGDRIAYGVVEGENVREIAGNLLGKWEPTERTHRLNEVELLVPVQPSKVLALAGNYKSHLPDGEQAEIPEKFRIPQLFYKLPSCLIADGAEVVIPPGTEEVHFEAELVVVIGKRAKNVPKDKALDYVFGVACGNDISARDWQKNDVQWWRAKGSDTFGPCGPFIVSGINYGDLMVRMRVNGNVLQEQSTKDFIHDIPSIISFVTQHVTLEPGDIIYTGTPGKTSAIKPGDAMEVEIEGIGVLRNKVAKSE